MMKSKVLAVLSDRMLELGPNPAPTPGINHWRYGIDEDGIGWLLSHQEQATQMGANGRQLVEATLGQIYYFERPRVQLRLPPRRFRRRLPLLQSPR